MTTSVANKWLMEIKLSSYFSVFIDTDPPTQTFEQKSGWSGDANQAYFWVSPYAVCVMREKYITWVSHAMNKIKTCDFLVCQTILDQALYIFAKRHI